MTTELQNKVWSILPKEFKEEVKKEYKVCSNKVQSMMKHIVKRAIYLNHVCNGSFHTEYKSMFNIL